MTALVLLSGGQDSTTCLYWATERFDDVRALGFDYGQKHAVELRQARKIAADAEVPFDVLDLRGALSGSALTEHEKDVDARHERASDLPASFVPGRNALFLTLAAAHAFRHGLHESGDGRPRLHLVGGMCQTDFSGYPDCRRVFVDAQERTLSLALGVDVAILTPLMYLDKAETWKLAAELGVVDVIVEDTHTDYNGDRSQRHAWGYGRLDNEASRLRKKGYEEAKAKDWI